MTDDELRECENYALSKRLSEINDADNLHFLAGLITDHDHLRAKLMTEPDRRFRQGKLDAMRPFLRFQALPLDHAYCVGYLLVCEQLQSSGKSPFRPVNGLSNFGGTHCGDDYLCDRIGLHRAIVSGFREAIVPTLSAEVSGGFGEGGG